MSVTPIPGASALTAVLSVSSLPVERFFFEGFLPARSAARRARLAELAAISVAVVFFEAARRLRETLNELVEIIEADRRILLAKELTKIHERIEAGTIAELVDRLDDDEFFERGEFVCVLAPPLDADRCCCAGDRNADASAVRRVAACAIGTDRGPNHAQATQRAVRIRGETSTRSMSALICWRRRVGQAVAAHGMFRAWRKVRAPQDRVPGNAWGARVHGKCNRE